MCQKVVGFSMFPWENVPDSVYYYGGVGGKAVQYDLICLYVHAHSMWS